MFAFRCRHNDLLTIQRIQMSDSNLTGILTTAVDKLSDPQLCEGLFHPHRDGNPLPSGKVLEEIIALSRAVLFPGFYGYSQLNNNTLRYHIGVSVERLYRLLRDQIQAGLCFVDEDTHWRRLRDRSKYMGDRRHGSGHHKNRKERKQEIIALQQNERI